MEGHQRRDEDGNLDPEAYASYMRDWRKRTGRTFAKPRVLSPHGTSAARARHYRAGQRACSLCAAWAAQAQRNYQATGSTLR